MAPLEEYGSSASSPTALSRRRSMPPLRLGDGSGAAGGEGGGRVGARLFHGGPNRNVRLSQVGGSLRHRARREAAGGRAVGCGSSRVRADRAHEEGTRPAPYSPLPGVYQLAALP